jgi:hypothetical protein
MLTRFRKYREQSVKLAAKETGGAAAPTQKRAKTAILIDSIGAFASKIGDLEFRNKKTANTQYITKCWRYKRNGCAILQKIPSSLMP